MEVVENTERVVVFTTRTVLGGYKGHNYIKITGGRGVKEVVQEHIHATSVGITRKMVPITGRASYSLYFWSFQYQNREEGGQNNDNRPINLLKVITFSTD